MAVDGAGHRQVHAERADRGRVTALERDADRGLVDGDDAEVNLELDVELDVDRVRPRDARAGDLEDVTERRGHLDAAGARDLDGVALGAVEYRHEVAQVRLVRRLEADRLVCLLYT